MNCQFCLTGRMGRMGNLTPAQIVDQVVLGCRAAREQHSRFNRVRVVFMGMGEPLDNLDAVL